MKKYKACLIVKGFYQQLRFDFDRTLSLVVKSITICVALTIALTKHWFVQQLDVNNAFLNGNLHEDIYTIQPPDFESFDKSRVCELHMVLYGLKQALHS